MIKEYRLVMREYRDLNGLSRREFSGITGYSVSTIQKYENGEQSIPEANAKYLGEKMGLSTYNILLFLRVHGNNPPMLGSELFGKDVSEEAMFEAFQTKYYISGLYTLEILKKSDPSFIENLAAETSIKPERLNQIVASYYNPYPVDLTEVFMICKALRKKFSEIFAVVSNDYFNDQNAVHIAHALQNYIESKKSPRIDWEKIDTQLNEREIAYLEEMLRVYRKLKL
ncbi:XRE family transcriptional regulator [Paenibacillus amylolyticus]|uniref:helix-turn-helix domain-containing protein n=1 Tax=Paenibacillus amylolyticus TaxID=1451 RepID=UPI00105AA0EE|nr:helix-turn-helix transcriptional regulator [Paenibacillus amylolyticus]TDL70409.1 XRE family transcriptional regulator [Paenibacillus amylolyticus]